MAARRIAKPRPGDLIGYARVSTTEQNPRLQLDALKAAGCARTFTDKATGTRADRPQWARCLDHLRTGDTLVVWRIDRLGRNLRDLIEIVNSLAERGIGVRSLFALMAEYEAALIAERTAAGLAAARARGRMGGRKPKMTPALVDKAQRMYDTRTFTMAEIAGSCGVTPATVYRHIRVEPTSKPTRAAKRPVIRSS
jgi:DNA invertase Pin-like site-specific DNA recombinase